MDDVAREVIVMKQHYGHAVHLHIMRFEELFDVVSVRHTHIRHTKGQKLNLKQRKNTENCYGRIRHT